MGQIEATLIRLADLAIDLPEVIDLATTTLDQFFDFLQQRIRSSEPAVLLNKLGAELQRLREGEPLQALGQGSVCEHCEVRGLCRRDHWAAPPDHAGKALALDELHGDEAESLSFT